MESCLNGDYPRFPKNNLFSAKDVLQRGVFSFSATINQGKFLVEI